jgi:hypothetical protein
MEKLGLPRENLGFPIEIFGNLGFPIENFGNLQFPIEILGKNSGIHGEF